MEHSQPPKDYPGKPDRGDPYGEQIGSAITHLGKPKPELLWVLLLVVVIEGAQIWEHQGRVVNTKAALDDIIGHLIAVEENRSQEIRRSQEAVKELAQALGRSHEYEGRALHERSLIREEE